ncbi:hypothetical protein VHEMI09717 [[Torrubiella] hemipterigena]|uniref:Chitin-binding type-1 domain-containing protein n=1 Tax=[Torrubiella] hemipterigena TaxID=1531966 RepID=A0A0A1TQX0_9HYPO|nr:hypothetical protein VHEMI09717 [[Torrubiella] hemipterigena]
MKPSLSFLASVAAVMAAVGPWDNPLQIRESNANPAPAPPLVDGVDIVKLKARGVSKAKTFFIGSVEAPDKVFKHGFHTTGSLEKLNEEYAKLVEDLPSGLFLETSRAVNQASLALFGFGGHHALSAAQQAEMQRLQEESLRSKGRPLNVDEVAAAELQIVEAGTPLVESGYVYQIAPQRLKGYWQPSLHKEPEGWAKLKFWVASGIPKENIVRAWKVASNGTVDGSVWANNKAIHVGSSVDTSFVCASKDASGFCVDLDDQVDAVLTVEGGNEYAVLQTISSAIVAETLGFNQAFYISPALAMYQNAFGGQMYSNRPPVTLGQLQKIKQFKTIGISGPKDIIKAYNGGFMDKFALPIFIHDLVYALLDDEATVLDKAAAGTALFPLVGCVVSHEANKAKSQIQAVGFVACTVGDALLLTPGWPVGAVIHLSRNIISAVYWFTDPARKTSTVEVYSKAMKANWKDTKEKALKYLTGDLFKDSVRIQWESETTVLAYRAAITKSWQDSAHRMVEKQYPNDNNTLAEIDRYIESGERALNSAACQIHARQWTVLKAALLDQAWALSQKLEPEFRKAFMDNVGTNYYKSFGIFNPQRSLAFKAGPKLARAVNETTTLEPLSYETLVNAVGKALEELNIYQPCSEDKIKANYCGASSRCEGCCSQYGYCGSGQEFCGVGCQPDHGSCFHTNSNITSNSFCGEAGNGKTCPGSIFGECCGRGGLCSNELSACDTGQGCQPAFGTCYALSDPKPQVSTAGGCGEIVGPDRGRTCKGYALGSCCSKFGVCGNGPAYCAPSTCQSQYGECKPELSWNEQSLPESVSRNGLCGAGYDNKTCTDSGRGDCCSFQGNCGQDEYSCGLACQSQHGSCTAGRELVVSLDGQCGAGHSDKTCASSAVGRCCSKDGICGDTWEACGNGCQHGYGECWRNVPEPKHDLCGPANGNTTCLGSRIGQCCHPNGSCGQGPSYCDIFDSCDVRFGLCNDKAKAIVGPTTETTRTSLDGTCGDFGFEQVTCLGSVFGNCCGPAGTCGTGYSFCGSTCQPRFGVCRDMKAQITKDEKCGPDYGNTTCAGAGFGECCGSKGKCGTGRSCEKDCLLGFGTCRALLQDTQANNISVDGRCGSNAQQRSCLGSGFGDCCSPHGTCGDGPGYCGSGCQDRFGHCNSDPENQGLFQVFPSAADISHDGKCGPLAGGRTCLGSGFGDCCSLDGECGSDYNVCSPHVECAGSAGCKVGHGACQPAYGKCWASAHGSQVSPFGDCNISIYSEWEPPTLQGASTVSCNGSAWGQCCSNQGRCGSSEGYCGRGNCNGKSGSCGCDSGCSPGVEVAVFLTPTSSPGELGFGAPGMEYYHRARPLMVEQLASLDDLSLSKYVKATGIENLTIMLRSFLYPCVDGTFQMDIDSGESLVAGWHGNEAFSEWHESNVNLELVSKHHHSWSIRASPEQIVPLRLLITTNNHDPKTAIKITSDKTTYHLTTGQENNLFKSTCKPFLPWGGETFNPSDKSPVGEPRKTKCRGGLKYCGRLLLQGLAKGQKTQLGDYYTDILQALQDAGQRTTYTDVLESVFECKDGNSGAIKFSQQCQQCVGGGTGHDDTCRLPTPSPLVRCGPFFGGQTCYPASALAKTDKALDCCSSEGYCGSGLHCASGCQKEFGSCNSPILIQNLGPNPQYCLVPGTSLSSEPHLEPCLMLRREAWLQGGQNLVAAVDETLCLAAVSRDASDLAKNPPVLQMAACSEARTEQQWFHQVGGLLRSGLQLNNKYFFIVPSDADNRKPVLRLEDHPTGDAFKWKFDEVKQYID